MTTQNARQYAAATERNREPILEIASGTGEHAVYFADKFKDFDTPPTV